MRYPNRLFIAGHWYKVTLKKSLKDENGQDLEGQVDNAKNMIRIVRGLCKSRKKEVLLHEAVHAISYNLNLNLTEKQVEALGREILVFIRENGLDISR